MRLLVLPSGAILEHGAIREPASAVVEEVSMEMVEANMELRWCPREAQGTLRGGGIPADARPPSVPPQRTAAAEPGQCQDRPTNKLGPRSTKTNLLYLILSYLIYQLGSTPAPPRGGPLSQRHTQKTWPASHDTGARTFSGEKESFARVLALSFSPAAPATAGRVGV